MTTQTTTATETRTMIAVNEPRPPKGSYRGELVTSTGRGFIGNVYVIDGRVMIARPREYGHGEIAHRLPGTFAPSDFERAGGLNVSAARYVKFWRFKVGA